VKTALSNLPGIAIAFIPGIGWPIVIAASVTSNLTVSAIYDKVTKEDVEEVIVTQPMIVTKPEIDIKVLKYMLEKLQMEAFLLRSESIPVLKGIFKKYQQQAEILQTYFCGCRPDIAESLQIKDFEEKMDLKKIDEEIEDFIEKCWELAELLITNSPLPEVIKRFANLLFRWRKLIKLCDEILNKLKKIQEKLNGNISPCPSTAKDKEEKVEKMIRDLTKLILEAVYLIKKTIDEVLNLEEESNDRIDVEEIINNFRLGPGQMRNRSLIYKKDFFEGC